MNIAKFLWTSILKNSCEWLVLKFRLLNKIKKYFLITYYISEHYDRDLGWSTEVHPLFRKIFSLFFIILNHIFQKFVLFLVFYFSFSKTFFCFLSFDFSFLFKSLFCFFVLSFVFENFALLLKACFFVVYCFIFVILFDPLRFP